MNDDYKSVLRISATLEFPQSQDYDRRLATGLHLMQSPNRYWLPSLLASPESPLGSWKGRLEVTRVSLPYPCTLSLPLCTHVTPVTHALPRTFLEPWCASPATYALTSTHPHPSVSVHTSFNFTQTFLTLQQPLTCLLCCLQATWDFATSCRLPHWLSCGKRVRKFPCLMTLRFN